MSDPNRPINQPGAPGLNQGHGHVFVRPDGMKARCGGPGLCQQCSADLARKQADTQATWTAEEIVQLLWEEADKVRSDNPHDGRSVAGRAWTNAAWTVAKAVRARLGVR